MIIWMNGTFGVGKTTTANRVVAMSDDLRLFDPERVGYLLMNNLADHEFTDFQHLPPWRTLVPVVADEVARFTGQGLVAVQTVLHEPYWFELREGLKARGHDVLHVLLDAKPETLHRRIESDVEGVDIRRWLQAADLVVDTTQADEEAVAQVVSGHLTPDPSQVKVTSWIRGATAGKEPLGRTTHPPSPCLAENCRRSVMESPYVDDVSA